VDTRLFPLNGLIALLSSGADKWPKLLREQGWERHQFEVKLGSSLGNFTADAVIYRLDPDVILLSETKSGNNIEQEQARKYLDAKIDDLRRFGAVPHPLRGRAADVRTLFVGTEDARPRLEKGLTSLGITGPLLSVGRSRVRLTGTSGVSGLDGFDEHHAGGSPPARFKIDHQSDEAEIAEVVVPIIAAAQARGQEFIGLEQICIESVPEWALLPNNAQGDFRRRIGEVLRRLASGPQKRDFRFEPRTGRSDGRVVILATPADRDPRGMTQAWQAAEGRAAKGLNRRHQPQVPGQMSLEDLAGEGGIGRE
jgi:hypothetical protein